MSKKKAIIIGGGPAGLSCAYELSKHRDRFEVMLIEKESLLGGIAKTVNYRGYYFDLGGHRFFTKSKEINDIWHTVLKEDFLKRPRLSRIYYNKKFFNYPIRPLNAFFGLGIMESSFILSSYISSKFFPYVEENTFEEWVSNRFGKRLYQVFFKTYTEKVWGISCKEIKAEWAAQRIKGLSLGTAILDALLGDHKKGKKIRTLINEFEYPKYGPGMMWDRMADIIEQNGGKIMRGMCLERLNLGNGRVESIGVESSNGKAEFYADYFISSIPLKELMCKLSPEPHSVYRDAAQGLRYRSLVSVSLIIKKEHIFPDNWIYIHSPAVKLGRIQNFKNWSPFMVPDQNMTCLGLEYFVNEGDSIWNMSQRELIDLGIAELIKIGLLNDPCLVVDGVVVKTSNTYPVYDAGYKDCVRKIREWLVSMKNLQTIGRSGMHRYNNMDHSMLTGIFAARNLAFNADFNVWTVNADEEYLEEKCSGV